MNNIVDLEAKDEHTNEHENSVSTDNGHDEKSFVVEQPYIEVLDKLIEDKKNKNNKITEAKKTEYTTALKDLITADKAFTERVEKYLYDGFVYAGAKPFVDWVVSSDNPSSALGELFKGQLFGKDTSSTFRVLISILAQLIKTDLPDHNILVPIIIRIPSSSRNKEHNLIGDGHKTISKYFIKELDENCHYPVLSQLDLDPVYIKSFIHVFDDFLSRINKELCSEKDTAVIASVNKWLHPEIYETNIQPKDRQDELHDIKNTAVVSQPKSSAGFTTKSNEADVFSRFYKNMHEMSQLVNEARNSALLSEKKNHELEETIKIMRRETEIITQQLENEKQKNTILQEQISELNNTISSLGISIQELNTEKENLSVALTNKENEIEQRVQMIDALRLDRERQSDERIQRLASKLKIEYRDFMDAESLQMDTDLGENMREQLKNVFIILKNAGISLG